jgi:small conductance mechanosensitive channel
LGTHAPGKDLVSPLAHLNGSDLSQAPATLIASCGRTPGIACRLVWDLSHSGTAAKLTAVYLAGPANLILKLAWLVLLALVARTMVHRLINRVTIRAADSPLHTRLRQSTEARGRRRPGRRRRRERAVTETAIAEADTALTGTTSGAGASAPTDTAAVHEAASERRHQRAHALGSILRNAASVTIFAIAAAIGLGDLGVNLAPVLASAGVVGIAVGFGAQNLVRDFLAGIFMLLEDQYGVGDVINIGDSTIGTVEAVSLRTTRLRDVNGVVWHLRNGALEKVGNESQGWARAVVDVPVPPGLDIPDTRQVMEQAASSMWRDRRWRKLMLEKPEVWGVQDISISDSQVVMRVAAKTLPLRQWEVARELRERVKSGLDAGPAAALEAGPTRARPARKAARTTASPTIRAETAGAGPDRSPVREEASGTPVQEETAAAGAKTASPGEREAGGPTAVASLTVETDETDEDMTEQPPPSAP